MIGVYRTGADVVEISPKLRDLAIRRTAHVKPYVMLTSIEDLLLSAYLQGLADMADTLEGEL